MQGISPHSMATRLVRVSPTEFGHPDYAEQDFYLLVWADVNNEYDHNKVYKSRIEVYYQLFGKAETNNEYKDRHYFSAEYENLGDGGVVRLTGSLVHGAVNIDPTHIRGRRLGTFLMNEIVKWAKQWPEAEVLPITLKKWQAHEGFENNKNRRNRFYVQFNIQFAYDSGTNESGSSKPMKVSELQLADLSKKKIEVLPLASHISGLIGRNEYLERDVAYHQEESLRRLSNQRSSWSFPSLPPSIWSLPQWWGFIGLIFGGMLAWLVLKLTRS
jgi:hypothetical protein